MPLRIVFLQSILSVACVAADQEGSVSSGDAGAVDAPAFADRALPPDARLASDASASDGRPPVASDAGPPAETLAERWQRASIYLLMVDRFADGSPNAEDACFDPAHPRRYHGGDFVGLRERLSYLQELGVDTVWVTPLTRQIVRHDGECGFHGYWADLAVPDDGALEPRLGSEEDLHALIDAMHARGMQLVLDMVVNHPGPGAPITASHPSWFHPREGCEHLGDPEETCRLADLPDFDQSQREVADYLVAHSIGWLRRFDFDGVRMDTVRHVPLSFFRERWIPEVREARPDLYLVGEVFDASPYATQRPYLDAGFDGLFDFRLRAALVEGLARDGSLDAAAQRVAEAWSTLGPERARLRSLFVENHDVPRFASEIHAPTEATAAARHRLALALITTTPGIPQLYSGTELGMAGFWPDNRRDLPAWAFDPTQRVPRAGYLGDPADTFALVRDLLRARRELRALHAGGYVELWRPGGSGVPLYAFLRTDGDAPVIVTLTTGDVTQRVPLRDNPHLDETTRRVLTDGTALIDHLGRTPGEARITDGNLDVDLPANTIAIWSLPGDR